MGDETDLTGDPLLEKVPVREGRKSGRYPKRTTRRRMNARITVFAPSAVVALVLAAGCSRRGESQAPAPTLTLDLGGGVRMELVLVPAGEFTMGSRDSAEEVARKGNSKAQYFTDEHPRHRVRITEPFYMGKYEVTQSQYDRVVGTNPSHFKGADLPVERVSWSDATEFCRRLSQRTGKTVRLPTEAEWEYACRAGTTRPFHFGETISANRVNYDADRPYAGGAKGTYRGRTTSVGSFPPNAWGLHDMHGNVYEWCADWYDKGYYAKTPGQDPSGPGGGGSRVLRGGSWLNLGGHCRSANRDWRLPCARLTNLGFRVAVVVVPGQ